MARMHLLSLLIYLVLQLLLINTSHAYQHRHLRRIALYHSKVHGVENVGPQEPNAVQQRIKALQADLEAKLALRKSVIQLLDLNGLLKEKRWGSQSGEDDGNDWSSSTVEELQRAIDALNRTIQALFELLSANLGTLSGTTTSSATATSTVTQYYTTLASSSSTPIASTTDTSSNATTVRTTTSYATPLTSTSSTSSPTVSTVTRYNFDPMSTSNVAVYYGQTDQTSSVPLLTICSDPDVDIIILAFINKLSTGPAGYPGLNLGAKCWAANYAQQSAGATGLIDCISDGFAQQVKNCQSTGKKVLLSIGGAVGYSETTIPSEQDAVRIADNIWNLFGAGGMDDDDIMDIRPFGDFVFDGFDIDNEDGSTLHWPLLISTLRNHFSTTTQQKPYYLTATPQCPHPDASIPLSSMRTSIDYIFIQFYNNPSCNLNSAGFLSSLQARSSDLSPTTNPSSAGPFININNGVSSPRVFVGAPAFPAAGSGWVGGEQFFSILAQVPGLGLPNFGGAMFWDGAYGELSKRTDGVYGRSGVGRTYMDLAKEALS